MGSVLGQKNETLSNIERNPVRQTMQHLVNKYA
jgi:hypothetical protein